MAKELVGWKEIADRLGVTVRAAQRYATMERDPLPCQRVLRSVRLDARELDEWVDRHREPFADGAPRGMVLVPIDPRLTPLVRQFHRAALRELERIGAPPFVSDSRQVTVEDHVARVRTAAPGGARGAG
ncbi:MAG TPA: hypothetical protein VGM56_00475 [Byssovorax sp.]|jgi:hypothetical protein